MIFLWNLAARPLSVESFLLEEQGSHLKRTYQMEGVTPADSLVTSLEHSSNEMGRAVPTPFQMQEQTLASHLWMRKALVEQGAHDPLPGLVHPVDTSTLSDGLKLT